MKTVSLSYHDDTGNVADELIARYRISDDGTAECLFLEPAYNQRFDECLTCGIDYPPGSLLHPFYVDRHAPDVDKLRAVFAQLVTIRTSVIADWPGETLKTYTMDELRTLQNGHLDSWGKKS